jgi:hypothetical protein
MVDPVLLRVLRRLPSLFLLDTDGVGVRRAKATVDDSDEKEDGDKSIGRAAASCLLAARDRDTSAVNACRVPIRRVNAAPAGVADSLDES